MKSNPVDKKIILASASPRRKELLAQIGLTFEIIPSSAEEKTESRKPSEMVEELSLQKARDVFEKFSEAERRKVLVIGSDTVVSLDGKIMGKPGSEENAVKMLTALQGREHQVYTGVTLIWEEQEADGAWLRKEKSFFEETTVSMYSMTKEEISSYVATGEPMDKAGAYGIQGRCAAYIKGITGDYNNVVGLPIGRLYQEMQKI